MASAQPDAERLSTSPLPAFHAYDAGLFAKHRPAMLIAHIGVCVGFAGC